MAKGQAQMETEPRPGAVPAKGSTPPPQVLDGGRGGRRPSAVEVQGTARCHTGSPREKALGDELNPEGRAEPGCAPGASGSGSPARLAEDIRVQGGCSSVDRGSLFLANTEARPSSNEPLGSVLQRRARAGTALRGFCCSFPPNFSAPAPPLHPGEMVGRPLTQGVNDKPGAHSGGKGQGWRDCVETDEGGQGRMNVAQRGASQAPGDVRATRELRGRGAGGAVLGGPPVGTW